MKISLIQYSIAWEDKKENFSKLEIVISPLFNKTDLVILPEMFNTGFSMDPGRLGELPGEETFLWMKSIADRGNLGICGSYIIKENNRFYNRYVFVSSDDEIQQYDKRHLFGIAGEDQFFTQGRKRVTFIFRGLRISPYICYDLRFPVWSRNRNEADLIIYTANWPEKRRDVWNTLLKARAIENQCYVAGVNRIGTDGTGVLYCGDSCIIHPYGGIIASAGPDYEGHVTAEISIDALSEFRKKFPVMKDADDFTILI